MRKNLLSNIFYSSLIGCRHWDEFYNENDIKQFAAAGISHLRIPVGYWIWDVVDGEPFPIPPATDNEGQRFYLKRLLKWAEDAGIKASIFILHYMMSNFSSKIKILY